MKKYIEIGGGYRKYDEITFLKGLSITTIVIMHMIQKYMTYLPFWFIKASSFGGTGVHIFFFCSGFGLFMSYRNRETGFSEFIHKRFYRIYFPYIVMILVYYITPSIIFNGNRMIALFSHILLFKMFFPKYELSFGPFWFMSTLIQFYLIFIPLCKIKKKIQNTVFLIVCTIVSVSWWIIIFQCGLVEERVLSSFFLQYLWEFALGMIIADKLYERNHIKFHTASILIMALCGVLLEALAGLKGGWLKSFNDIPALFGYGALGLLLYQSALLRTIGVWIGNISYEWYLVHMLVFSVVLSTCQNMLISAAAFLVSIGAAYGYNKAFLFCKKCIKNRYNH